MKVFIFLFFFLLFFKTAFSQRRTNEIKKVYSFIIDSIIKRECSDKFDIYISNSAHNSDFVNCVDYPKTLSNFFNKSEIEYINLKIKDTTTFTLIKKTVESPRVKLSDVYIDFILKGKFGIAMGKGQDSVLKIQGNYQHLCFLADPIFIRKHEFCIISYGIHRGKSGICLLQKINRKWRLINESCIWYAFNPD